MHESGTWRTKEIKLNVRAVHNSFIIFLLLHFYFYFFFIIILPLFLTETDFYANTCTNSVNGLDNWSIPSSFICLCILFFLLFTHSFYIVLFVIFFSSFFFQIFLFTYRDNILLFIKYAFLWMDINVRDCGFLFFKTKPKTKDKNRLNWLYNNINYRFMLCEWKKKHLNVQFWFNWLWLDCVLNVLQIHF